jgi:hypothetical protein
VLRLFPSSLLIRLEPNALRLAGRAQLPRQQQQRIIDVVEALVAQQAQRP